MQAPTEIFEAIALQKCLKVTYNKMVVTLAPHILYTRHDEMYIDAVTTERDGRPGAREGHGGVLYGAE